MVSQIATLIAVYASWGFARVKGIGWGWAGVIWLFSIITYFPLDVLKYIIRYALTGKAWDNLLERKVCIFFWVQYVLLLNCNFWKCVVLVLLHC